MKKTILIIISLCNSILAQETFLRYYHPYGKVSAIDQTSDGGFVLSSNIDPLEIYRAYNCFLIKTDDYGNLQWHKSFASYKKPQVIRTADDGIVFMYQKYEWPVKPFSLIKFNNDGSEIWRRDIINDFQSLRSSPDSGCILFGQNTIMKLDKNGIEEWTTIGSFGSTSFLVLNDGSFIRTNSSLIFLYNKEGQLQWSQSLPYTGINNIAANDSGIIVCGNNYVALYSYKGSIQKLQEINSYYQVCKTELDEFSLIDSSRIIRINSSLETLWIKEQKLNYNPEIVKSTSDSGLMMAGADIWLLKMDSKAEYNSLSFVKPIPHENIKPDSLYEVKWIYKNSSNVNLYYSTDDGKIWKTIKENISNTGSYFWQVPAEYSDCYLKITSSENNDISVLTESIHIHFNHPEDYIAVNQIKMWAGNNGMGSHNPADNGTGLIWPGGENGSISAIFLDGILWGGKVDGNIKVNGGDFRFGLIPGKIPDNGLSDDRNSYKYNIWKINKYWQSLPEGDKKAQYKNNYKNWPGELGAPFKDINQDGIFTKGVDEPEFPGDEVLWFVSNDMDSNVTKFVHGSTPIGLEVQTTIYGFNRTDDLSDVVFKKHKVINKSSKDIQDMYLSQFSDPDLGYHADDFAGCDTLLDLGYVYNGDNNDEGYYGVNPPAVGYKIVQGPIIVSSNDSAFYDNKIVFGKTNLRMSAFLFYLKGIPNADIPILGIYYGSIEMYNNMQGKYTNGTVINEPVTGVSTKMMVSGDPVAGTGWYEGPKGWPYGPTPYERSFLITAGPFNLAPSDTQEVVIAIIMARGSDNINSIAELKRKAAVVQEFYDQQILTGVTPKENVPVEYSLLQNYPNPFNPSTTIKYTLPERTNLTLKIFDILGKEVTTLVNEEKAAGNYQVTFNAQNMASGIYYYQLKTSGFVQTKKMILIK